MTPAARQRRFQRITAIGCLACRFRGYFAQPCQVHHLNLDQHAGQERLGDAHTIGLCPWHHVGEPLNGASRNRTRELLGPSMKHEPVKFRELFGTDRELLQEQNRLIAIAESRVIGREAV